MSEDAGIEPRTVATLALTARRSNYSAESNGLKLYEKCKYEMGGGPFCTGTLTQLLQENLLVPGGLVEGVPVSVEGVQHTQEAQHLQARILNLNKFTTLEILKLLVLCCKNKSIKQHSNSNRKVSNRSCTY